MLTTKISWLSCCESQGGEKLIRRSAFIFNFANRANNGCPEHLPFRQRESEVVAFPGGVQKAVRRRGSGARSGSGNGTARAVVRVVVVVVVARRAVAGAAVAEPTADAVHDVAAPRYNPVQKRTERDVFRGRRCTAGDCCGERRSGRRQVHGSNRLPATVGRGLWARARGHAAKVAQCRGQQQGLGDCAGAGAGVGVAAAGAAGCRNHYFRRFPLLALAGCAARFPCRTSRAASAPTSAAASATPIAASSAAATAG